MKVLILGGGFTAVGATQKLREAIEDGRIEATVVMRANFLCVHGLISEMVTGRVSPSHIAVPARRIFPPAEVHVAEIERIDLDARRVHTSRSLDGAPSVLEYDQIVIGLGSVDRLEVYPGLAEHSFKLRRYPDALKLKNHILEMFELAEVERDPDERRRLLTFFIAGGGFSGTELAGELAHLATLLTGREYPRIGRGECRVVLVEPGASILPEMVPPSGRAYPRLVRYGLRRLRELGVEVRTETFVTAASPNEVVLSSGERIPTRTIISAVGSKMGPLVERLDVPKDERGKVLIRPTGQVEGRDGVWAGGEAAALQKPGGGSAPPNAVYALMSGRLIGANLVRVAAGRKPRPFRFRGVGQAAPVGNRTAAGMMGPIQVTGIAAWLVWRTGLLIVVPTRDRRLRMILDWLIWPLVGRDIAELRLAGRSDYEVRHHIFQAGEVIAAESRTRRYIHVIVEGEVELVEAGAAEDEGRVLDTLGPGDHFGVRWLDSFEPELARAKTVVRTLAIRRDQAPVLQDLLDSAGRLVAESGHFPAITAEMEEAMKASLEKPKAGPPPGA